MMKTIFPTALVLALLLACSGGGGSDNGGIGGTGFSQGAVTDVSMSARVTGTLWETDANTEFVPAGTGEADLQVGQVVLIEGTLGSMNVATRVVFDDIVTGPVSAPVEIDPLVPGLREFMILDKRVVMSVDTTVFVGTTFLDLMAGDNVEVSGFEGPDGITATRIEFEDTSDDVEFRGAVSNFDADVFDLGAVQVNILAGTEIDEDFGLDGIMDGDFVEVEGVIVATNPFEVDADEIELRNQGIEDDGDLGDVEIEGLVTDFVNLGSFRVAGQLVTTFGIQGVQFEPADSSFVQNGARVEVEGDIVAGVLMANEVKLRNEEVRVDAAGASDVDVAAGSFTLAGIAFSTDSATRFEDVEDLSGIAACGFLETRGILLDDVVRATRIKCEGAGDAVSIRARVEAFDAVNGHFDLLGIEIDTAEAEFSGFPGVVDEADFYLFLNANPGALVEAEDDDGDLTTFGVAKKVEREEPDDD
jgi:hypothetical protein